MPKTKFLLAAACLLGTVVSTHAATFWPTSPLVQIGDDTDIFFNGTLAFDFKDNLYSVADKTSSALVTFTPGFDLEYAKDSPLSANLKLSRSFLRYNKSEFKDLETGQDNILGSVNYDSGGPLNVGLSSSYNESARNDNLANVLGADSGQILGATLIRQSSYVHSLNVSYLLTEKIKLNAGFINNYNHYLNPVKTKSSSTVLGVTTDDIAYNTNSLNEINTKSIPIDITYTVPSGKLTYGFSFKHDVSDYLAAPYFHTQQVTSPLPAGPVTPVPRPAGSNKLTQNFYGFTINGQPTSSGKIRITTRLGYFNSDLDGVGSNGASYNLRVSHNLTERLTHEFGLSHDVSPSSTGGTLESDTFSYGANYALSDKTSLNFHAVKSKSVAGTTQVDALDFNFGIHWEYNKHFNVSALVDILDSKVKNSPESNFKANSLNITSTFRY